MPRAVKITLTSEAKKFFFYQGGFKIDILMFDTTKKCIKDDLEGSLVERYWKFSPGEKYLS